MIRRLMVYRQAITEATLCRHLKGLVMQTNGSVIVYHIHNNLPYAEKLATAPGGSGIADEKRYNPNRTVKNWATPGGGSSHQTNGPGWIDLIAREMTDFARRTADRIGRQD
jgi:hypothetical protein